MIYEVLAVVVDQSRREKSDAAVREHKPGRYAMATATRFGFDLEAQRRAFVRWSLDKTANGGEPLRKTGWIVVEAAFVRFMERRASAEPSFPKRKRG